jgi:hypothetical protein
MTDLILDAAHIYAGFLGNPHLSDEERRRGYDGARRIRPVLAEQDELNEQEAEAEVIMAEAKKAKMKADIEEAVNKRTHFHKKGK